MLARLIPSLMFVMFCAPAYGQTLSQVNGAAATVWVQLPDFTQLNAAGDLALNLLEFGDSLASAAGSPQNPDGLTVEGAIEILQVFNSNLEDRIPCGPARDQIVIFLTNQDLPDEAVNAAIDQAVDCDGGDGPGVIDGPIDDVGGVWDGPIDECGEYDAQGNCLWRITSELCDDCECILMDLDGNCILWRDDNPPPSGIVLSPGGDPDVDPEADPGIDPGDGTGGGGQGGDPGGSGGEDPGNGGGGSPSSAGVEVLGTVGLSVESVGAGVGFGQQYIDSEVDGRASSLRIKLMRHAGIESWEDIGGNHSRPANGANQ
jgi:hypothetical protein